jgi:hypothetical protein
MTMEQKLYSLGADYLELKEVRDHYAGLMKQISTQIDELMTPADLASFKEGYISISMANGAKTSIKTFKQKLMEAGVAVEDIAHAEEMAKPAPKYSPRISKLSKTTPQTVQKGIGQ